MRIKHIIALVILTMLCTPLLGAAGMKLAIDRYAAQRAESILREALSDAPPENSDAAMIALVASEFRTYSANPDLEVHALLLKLRPYITNRRLPEALRPQTGALEVLYPEGACDNAARHLIYLLAAQGIPAVQYNMATSVGAHSAVLAQSADGPKLLDPYYGVVGWHNGRIIGPEQARELALRKQEFLKKTDGKANVNFYADFARAGAAAEDDPLQIVFNIDVPPGGMKEYGKIDGDHLDVRGDIMAEGHLPYAYYIGRRYNNNWQRVFRFTRPAHVEITLAQDYDPGVMTANIAPRIQGRTLAWDVPQGQELVFDDSKARLSLARMNSYIYIDRIAVTAKE